MSGSVRKIGSALLFEEEREREEWVVTIVQEACLLYSLFALQCDLHVARESRTSHIEQSKAGILIN